MFARLLLLFTIVPLVELYLLLRVGSRIGLGPTLGIIVLTAILGASLTRAQGMRAWRRYHEALSQGRLPHAEVMDGLMILIAGAVLLTPGFLTDATGFLLLVPAVRARVRHWLGRVLKDRIQVRVMGRGGVGGDPRGREAPRVGERVVQGKVIDPKAVDPQSDETSP